MLVPGSANPLLLRTVAAAAGGISRSLRLNAPDSAYLNRTPASAGNRKTWTWAGWVKRSALSSTQCVFTSAASSSVGFSFEFSSDNAVDLFDYSGGYLWRLKTTQVFRDPSAWQHIVLSFDSTQGTSANRVKFYANGVQVETFSTATYPSSSFDSYVNATNAHGLGSFGAGVSNFFSGYLADIYFIDGQALTPSSFTETDATTGQLIPKAYTGSYGTNGFHLDFADNASTTTIGYDVAGSNDWTANNLSVTAGAGNDSLVDVPTNGAQTDTGVGGEVRGNYCTLNPLDRATHGSLANGNLDLNTSGGSSPNAYGTTRATFGLSSGKWYWEVTPTSFSDGGMIGIMKADGSLSLGVGQDSSGWSYLNGGSKYTGASASSYGASYTTNDVIGIAFDADNGTLAFYKNGASQGTAFTGLTSGPYFPAISDNGGSGTTGSVFVANFGQRAFAYTAPSGYKALNTANLPAPLVTKPSTVMDVKLYTGNGSTQTISGLGFSPDLVWGKNRSSAFSHELYDTVRGAQNLLRSNLDAAEFNDSTLLTAFTSDGFTVGSNGGMNGNTNAIVAWTWDAGSSTVTNTAGSITGTVSVRANTTAGFSIVTYTGTGTAVTVGHGLGVAPSLIIVKSRSNASTEWQVYHQSLGINQTIQLNSTSAASTITGYWGSTAPSSTVFGLIGTGYQNNISGATYVAYCFAPVVGYSSFGSYTGNGSSNGVFVYTGHRVRWLMIKRTDASDSWQIMDAARSDYNVADDQLYADLSNAEATTSSRGIDFLSNGFKIRGDNSGINASGGTYVYVSFAESPFNYARAR